MVRASVLVSGGGANLQAIIDQYLFGELPGFEPAAVISSSETAHALERARRAHIEAYTVDRQLFPNNASFCNALLNKLRDLDTELVVCAGFTEKLNYPILHFYKNRVINVQPALFPAFCSDKFDPAEAVKGALDLGLRYTGATAYFMTEEDNGFGPIILQQPVAIRSDDTPVSLSERIMSEGEWPLLPEAVGLYCAGKLRLDGKKVIITD